MAKSSLKSAASRTLAAVLKPQFLRLANRNNLSILMYHGVVDRPLDLPDPCMMDVELFDAQMRFLRKHYRTISLSQAIEESGHSRSNRPAVVVTFDDGYQNNCDIALPILNELQIPATIYIATAFIDTDQTVWTGALQDAFAETASNTLSWRDETFDLSTLQAKQESLSQLKASLKSNPQENLYEEVAAVRSRLIGDGQNSIGRRSPYRILDSESVKVLCDSDMVELGAHSHNHYILSRIPPEMQKTEIQQSLKIIEEYTGEPCVHFAYPNGKHSDYDTHTLSILRESGVRSAVTTNVGVCESSAPALELNRVGVSADSNLSSFALSIFDTKNRLRRRLIG